MARVLPPSRSWPGSRVPVAETLSQRRVIVAIAVVAVVVTSIYLVWRILFTIDPTSALLGIPLLVIEVWAFASAILYGLVLWDLDAIPPATPRDFTDKRVVIVIPTYNEPPEVLMPTLLAAKEVKLATQVWVLDDGRRDWVRDVCEGLNIVWRTRENNDHAKAGNINAALPDIDADIIAVLDADHVPSPELISHTIGYFDNAEVAVVQTPQDFYNQDSFEHDVLGDRVMHEEELFYRAMAVGRNRWNAAFWVGTGALIRMDVLRSIGGVATYSVTEDIATTITVHRRGWHTVHHNEVLARGLAPTDADQYLTQRVRWGSGAMQVMRKQRFMTTSGLTFMQRMSYLHTLLGWWDGWKFLVLLLLPGFSLMLTVFPFNTDFRSFIIFFGIAFAIQQFALWKMGRKRAVPWRAVVFDVVKMPATMRASLTLFTTKPMEFTVTAKGRLGDSRSQSRIPPLLFAILIFQVVALVVFGLSLIDVLPLDYPSIWMAWVTVGWVLLNSTIVVMAMSRIRSSRFASERRSSARVDVDGYGVLDGETVRVHDLSLGGARLGSTKPIEPLTIAELELDSESLLVVVRSVEPIEDGAILRVQYLPGQETAAARIMSALVH
jgi:cellulose synthase/poly-beta-1,6-N-acetylglucosamine synthase-like glycosyltransferase